jgi:opacity protein-like surface antigen
MNIHMLRQLISGAILLFIITSNAHAEKFFDLYGGANSTDDSTADVVDKPTPAPGIRDSISLDFDKDVTLGMRVGVWQESPPYFGMAFDISYFCAEADNAEFSVVPLSFLLMARMPLMVSSEFSQGRFQPYIAVGPSLMIYDFEVDLTNAGGRKIDGSSGDFGFDLRGGLLWQITEKVAVFTEYRYTHVKVDFDADDSFLMANPYEMEVETDLNTHHALAGMSFRF